MSTGTPRCSQRPWPSSSADSSRAVARVAFDRERPRDVERRDHPDRQAHVGDDEQVGRLVLGHQCRGVLERELGRDRDHGRCGDGARVCSGSDRGDQIEVGDDAPGTEPVVGPEHDDRMNAVPRHHPGDVAQRCHRQAGEDARRHHLTHGSRVQLWERDGHLFTSR
jgi:hypothetical protein